MKHLVPTVRRLGAVLAGAVLLRAGDSAPPDRSAWKHYQEVAVPQAGLVRLALPPATLGAARPDLADLRLLDPAGREVPFVVERRQPTPASMWTPRNFQVQLGPAATVILMETGFTQAVERVVLQTPAPTFIKAVRVEGSADGVTWSVLARGVPIFRQPGGSQLEIPLPPAPWSRLRLTVDDQRSGPVPFTGALIRGVAQAASAETLPAELLERVENGGVSRLRLRLPAANQFLAELELDSPEPLFTREASLFALDAGEFATNEVALATGTIYRLALEGQAAASNLVLHVGTPAASREVVLRIRNQDSPPLAISAARVRVRPVELLFRADTDGPHRLLSGHRTCPAPRYDLAVLGGRIAGLPAAPLRPGPLQNNPAFQPPPVLADVRDQAAELDVSAWRFRKAVTATQAGVQRLELDLETLAHARPDLGDLRLMRGGRQVPFLRDTTSGTHRIEPAVQADDDPKQPGVSRWRLRLPQARLPLERITCVSPTALFQRHVELYEELKDERGGRYRRSLGAANWAQMPGERAGTLTLTLNGRLETDTLWLETANGDNPAIMLERFEFTAPAPRLVCKLDAPAADLFLYFGNATAYAPSYDLSLVAAELRAASKAEARLGSLETLKPGSGWRFGTGIDASPWLWVVLAVVAGGLLLVITRLLPKPPEPDVATDRDAGAPPGST